MSESPSEIRIWATIRSFVVGLDGEETDADEKSLREELAEFIGSEVLAGTGDAEMEYSYTGVRVEGSFPDAYCFDEDGKQLRLMVLVGPLGPQQMPVVEPRVLRDSVSSVLSRFTSIITQSSKDGSADLEEGIGEYCSLVRQRYEGLRKVSVKAVIVGSYGGSPDEAAEMFGPRIEGSGYGPFELAVDVLDVPHLQNSLDAGDTSGTVVLHFEEFLGHPLRCLEANSSGTGFSTFLAIIPGEALAEIYGRYGSKILQKNLRNFLQATGKVNKGIQKTLKDRPDRFLAYNNGLTVTAASVELDGSGRITTIHDFQIVNGGQTTASLDYARRFSGTDLSRVSVQAKIVVDATNDRDFIDDVSNFANSQNKVKISDFAARDAFNERLYHKVYLNSDLQVNCEDGSHTFWFFESFRGGYLTQRNSLSGGTRRKFDVRFPRSQVFDKLELAKVENGWDGLPFFVCRGADKNFNEWRRRTEPHRRADPSIEECKEIIAKVILFRRVAELVKEQGYPGFKSQILAYAYSSLRFLLEQGGKEVKLDRLFDEQGSDEELDAVLLDLVRYSRQFLTGGAAGQEDPAQWAKKPIAWQSFQRYCGARSTKAPAILQKLQRARWLRDFSEHEDQTLRRVLDQLEVVYPKFLRAVEIRERLNLEQSQWSDARSQLLALGRIEQQGARVGARYRFVSGD